MLNSSIETLDDHHHIGGTANLARHPLDGRLLVIGAVLRASDIAGHATGRPGCSARVVRA
jgi:hypothetical protein